jgi:hypothetical protein
MVIGVCLARFTHRTIQKHLTGIEAKKKHIIKHC